MIVYGSYPCAARWSVVLTPVAAPDTKSVVLNALPPSTSAPVAEERVTRGT